MNIEETVLFVIFVTGVIKDPIGFAVFCIARTYMRLLDTHVVGYATVCARTVRIMHRWCGGWAWLHALSWHTCWMLRNCTYMFHATQLYVPVLFVSCTDGVGGGRGCMHCLGTHVGCYATAHTCSVCYATVARSGCMRCLDAHVGCCATAHKCFICYAAVYAHSGCMRCFDTHVGCYATAHTCWMLRNCTYMLYATQLYVLVHDWPALKR